MAKTLGRCAISCFNPRSRAGSDVARGYSTARLLGFQSTLPRGERRLLGEQLLHEASFNPRSRAGSDWPMPTGWRRICKVSIHAPARGATSWSWATTGITIVSIHAPARGATHRWRGPLSPSSCFNPRSRAGSDIWGCASSCGAWWFQSTLPRGERRLEGSALWPEYVVSIHAPARGATHSDWYGSDEELVSIHAPARGATILGAEFIKACMGFNPRSRAGSDCSKRSTRCASCCFNPRSRAGSDDFLQAVVGQHQVSIHAPARGATLFLAADGLSTTGFNPRSRAGSDAPMLRDTTCLSGFNPRSRAGSDKSYLPGLQRDLVSIHAPARGATLYHPRQSGIF